MSNNYPIFREAAEKVRRGWLKGAFTDADGRVCMVGSVLSSAPLRDDELPLEMVLQIDNALRHSPSYWALRSEYLLFSKGGQREALQDAITAWNDLFWRRKSAVVRALTDVADGLEVEWRRDERIRLTLEVERLRAENTALHAKVARLETDNAKLRRRIANFFDLKSSRAELSKLDSELDETWAQLTAISPSS